MFRKKDNDNKTNKKISTKGITHVLQKLKNPPGESTAPHPSMTSTSTTTKSAAFTQEAIDHKTVANTNKNPDDTQNPRGFKALQDQDTKEGEEERATISKRRQSISNPNMNTRSTLFQKQQLKPTSQDSNLDKKESEQIENKTINKF